MRRVGVEDTLTTSFHGSLHSIECRRPKKKASSALQGKGKRNKRRKRRKGRGGIKEGATAGDIKYLLGIVERNLFAIKHTSATDLRGKRDEKGKRNKTKKKEKKKKGKKKE